MKWKNRLKTILANAAETEKNGKCLETTLTKADKTQSKVVSSVFVSGELANFSKKTEKLETLPICSNCALEMIFIENEKIWFCPIGCEKRK